MKELVLLLVFGLVSKLVKGQANTIGSVYCHNNHTVDITIINVEDLSRWNESQWRLQDKPECEPTFSRANETVTYTDLVLPDCALAAEQLSESIKYILKINPITPNPGGTGQLRVYDQLYFVSCDYDNQNRSTTSFVPITNRGNNDSSTGFFTFSLQAFYFPNHTGDVPSPVELGKTLYFKANVVTQSSTSNLDLFPEHCWSSRSSNPMIDDGNLDLIIKGCGNDTVSEDLGDTLSYRCTDDDIKETFSIQTFRYFGANEGDAVFFHCEFRVCLRSAATTACDCPSPAECATNARKRRSVNDVIVDESQLYYVTSGPFVFQNDHEEEEVNEEEGESDEQEESQSFSTSLVTIVAVSGVIAIAICTAVCLLVRKRTKKQQDGDLNIAT
ncbi:uncharacterized protein LOC110045068 [Orbicella faveolata]|uniref:uncharacterized protein LOC110045068 n=1 Tax=Orbicella faveolata TaxID=48498 RepID=UPI0009E50A5D|nr:uncharacterized protein LOC110045068 [Orbicella faveolata]XP_020606318.1 uncharacterized protein LOC110045068 [Orbicella faveolata]